MLRATGGACSEKFPSRSWMSDPLPFTRWRGTRCSREKDYLRAVAPDCFNRATFHGFLAKGLFLRTLGLLVNVGMTAVVVAFEIRRGRFAAEIAIDALIIDVEFSFHILRVLICSVCHSVPFR